MNSYLLITVLSDKTNIKYYADSNVIIEHVYGYGDEHLHADSKKNAKSDKSRLAFMSGVLYILNMINAKEKIPTLFILEASNYIKHYEFLNDYLYQEFTKLSPAVKVISSVIINGNSRSDFASVNLLHTGKAYSPNHERHQKTISKFKV